MRPLWLSVMGLAFLCLPAAASDEANQCSPGQVLGHWYIHGIGSNCEWMVQFMAKEMMSCNVTSQEEGSFTVATNLTTEYGSMDVEMTYTKQKDGVYLHKSEWGDKIIDKRKTDCKTYAMTSVRDLKDNEGVFCIFVSLYAREMSVSDSVKQSFIDFATEMHIDREQIFLLARKDATPKSA
ncbi:protein AMBP-like [Pantherophis guttatus]|uniref:Protein AMBP-like n=1 Tax=Pantherophis guttatus TaxID=94885 RepID=A0A6P9DLJ1_PANGU|nr:protein AMBP-like [Pantherophis guttatus]